MRNGRTVDWDNPLLVMGVKARARDWDPIADYIRASGHGAAQTGRTHDLHPTARPQAERQILLAMRASSTHDSCCVRTRRRSIAIEQVIRSRPFFVPTSQAHSILKSNLRISFSSRFKFF